MHHGGRLLAGQRQGFALAPGRFEEYLQSRGMRMTQQRRLLLEHVFSRHEHFDADALIEQMPSSGKEGHVSRPTVYRTLNEFVDAGLLRRFQLGGRAVYEHDYGYPQHDHLHCLECQKLIEFKATNCSNCDAAWPESIVFMSPGTG